MSREHYSRQPQHNEASVIEDSLGHCWIKTGIMRLLVLTAPNYRGLINRGAGAHLGFERDLDLKRSEAEKIVAATEAGQATIVCKRAIRVRCRKRSSCQKTDELGPKKVLARESDICG